MFFFLELSEQDAKKLQRKTISYIPLNGERYFNDKAKDIYLQVAQLSLNDGGLFYSPPERNKEHLIKKRLFTNPSLKDTIDWSDIQYGQDMEFTKEWIEMLDNSQEVVVRGEGCALTSDGRGHSITSYSREKISSLAKERLHYVTNLFPETKEEWNKNQWQQWFQNIMNHKETMSEECNKEVWNMERYFNSNYVNSSRFYTDKSSNIIGIVEVAPFYEDYKDQQFILFNQKLGKSFTYHLHTAEDPFKEAINGFIFHHKQLFILTESFKWAKFEYDTSKDIFKKVALKSILPESFITKKEEISISDSYYNEDIYFVLFSKDEQNISQYYIASFKTQTGDLIAVKHLSKLIEGTKIASLKDLQFKPLRYCNNDQNYFVLALKNEKTDKACFLKVNEHLEDTKVIPSQVKLDWREYILTTDNAIVHVRYEDDILYRYLYKDDFSGFVNHIDTKIKSREQLMMDNSLIVKDGAYIRLIVEYKGAYASGWKQEKIHLLGDRFDESCVYLDVPLEEPNDEREKILFYVSKNNNDSWTVFMKDYSVLRFMNIK